MELHVKTGDIEIVPTSVIVLPIAQGKLEQVKATYPQLYAILEPAQKEYETFAEESSYNILYTPGKIRAEKLLLVGMGKTEKITTEKIRSMAGSVCGYLKKKKYDEAAILSPHYLLQNIETEKVQRGLCEGLLLSSYKYDQYKTKKEDKEKESKLHHLSILVTDSEKSLVDKVAKETRVLAESVYMVRDLINGPANVVTPSYLANVAKNLARQCKLKCRILEPSALKKENMNLMLGVAKGSEEEPRFIVLEYRPKNAKKTIALVGKGVCFDSGGLQIKPGKSMADMKEDMAGAAVVLGAIKAAATLQLPINIIGCMPCVENMPGCRAQKPGDIITSASGKTVEIMHTDAEGRLILGDALHYATKYKPELIIDLATLTGACVVALGSVAAGIFSNDKTQADKMIESGEETYERVWPLPMFEEYSEMIKGDLADIKNLGSWDGDAGAITAAAFLKEFVGETLWIHLDIAGVAMSSKEGAYTPKGATGFGVRLLVDFLKKYS